MTLIELKRLPSLYQKDFIDDGCSVQLLINVERALLAACDHAALCRSLISEYRAYSKFLINQITGKRLSWEKKKLEACDALDESLAIRDELFDLRVSLLAQFFSDKCS